jgi:hypothetical protein
LPFVAIANGIDYANQSVSLGTGDTLDITVPGGFPGMDGITWVDFFQPGPLIPEGGDGPPTTPYCLPQFGFCSSGNYLNGYSLSAALVSADGKTVLPLLDLGWDYYLYRNGYITAGTIGVQGEASVAGVPAWSSEAYTLFNNGNWPGLPEYQQLFGSSDITLQVTNTGLPLTLGGFGVEPGELTLSDMGLWLGAPGEGGDVMLSSRLTFVAAPEPQTIALTLAPLIALLIARKSGRCRTPIDICGGGSGCVGAAK